MSANEARSGTISVRDRNARPDAKVSRAARSEALAVRDAFHDEVEPRPRPADGDLAVPGVKEWARKLVGTMARIASVLHTRSADSLLRLPPRDAEDPLPVEDDARFEAGVSPASAARAAKRGQSRTSPRRRAPKCSLVTSWEDTRCRTPEAGLSRDPL